MLSDTVGFIRDLPHRLIASFKATLEESRQADLLLHVADASNPAVGQQITRSSASGLAVALRIGLLVGPGLGIANSYFQRRMRARSKSIRNTRCRPSTRILRALRSA